MTIRQNDSVGAANSYLQELTEALQEIANLEAQIATMPEGDEKADKELALSIAIVNRNRAQKNLRSKGPGSKLVKDLDIASVQHEIDECDLLIAATNTRKAEIQGS